MTASILTASQIEDFHKNGILVIEDFLNESDVKAMKEEILRLVEEMNPSEHRGVFSTVLHDQVIKI